MTDSTIKCILLDDELPGLDYLRLLCSQIKGLEVVRCFVDPSEFLSELPSLNFDACILDINMPGISGLQVAQLLSGKPVLFVSAHSEFAADAFECDAVDFVRKPVSKDRLEKAIGRLRSKLGDKPATGTGVLLTVNTSQGKGILSPSEICLISTSDEEKRDKIVFLKNGEKLIVKNISLDEWLKQLPPGLFARINKREIVAASAIRFIRQDEIVLKINSEAGKPLAVYLGEVYRADFLKMLERNSALL